MIETFGQLLIFISFICLWTIVIGMCFCGMYVGHQEKMERLHYEFEARERELRANSNPLTRAMSATGSNKSVPKPSSPFQPIVGDAEGMRDG